MRGLWLALLLLWSPVPAELDSQTRRANDSMNVDRLISADCLAERRRQRNKILRNMDQEPAARLLAEAKRLPPAKARVLKEMLAAGGPWLPLLVEELHRFDAGCLKDIFHLLLENRAIRRELLPEGTGATSFIDLFGNARIGAGIRLLFPGEWRPIPLTELLDAINDACGVEFPLVLDPELGDDAAVVRERPAEIAGAVSVDRLLRDFGLGVTYLETVALVERGAGSCYNRTLSQQKEDTLLLDKVMRIVASPLSGAGCRKAAYKALAYLDLPGLVEGYAIEFSKGRTDPGLDILLYDACLPRLIARLVMTGDTRTGTVLMEAACAMDRDDPRRRRLQRVLFALPSDQLSAIVGAAKRVPSERLLPYSAACGLLDEREVMAAVESSDPEKRRLGFEAAWRLFRIEDSLPLFESLFPVLLRGQAGDSALRRILDTNLIPSLSRHLTDERLASWIRSPGETAAVYEIIRLQGGLQSALACLDRISGMEMDFDRIRCLLAIHGRIPEDAKKSLTKAVKDAMDGKGDTPIEPGDAMDGKENSASALEAERASLFVLNALLSGSMEETNQAVGRTADLFAQGGERARLAARLFALIGKGRMVDYLKQWTAAWRQGDDAVRGLLERAALQSVAENALDAEKLRFALMKRPEHVDYEDLIRDLRGLGSMSSLDSYRVPIDI